MGTNLTKGSSGGTSNEDRPILPTDIYRVKCTESEMEDDTFAKPDKNGQLPQKIKTTWEVTRLTPEQDEAAEERGEEWVGVHVWHRFNPYYGTVKAGGPSKFMEFIDLVRAQGGLPHFDPEDFDITDLVDIELKASIAEYTKTMGENAGKPGNKITAWAALKPAKKGATSAPAASTASAPKNPASEVASEKQRGYIAMLQEELGWSSAQLADFARECKVDLVTMTKGQASTFIDQLKEVSETMKQRAATPKASKGAPAPRVAGDEVFEDDNESSVY